MRNGKVLVKLGAVLLAAGRGERFGANKLLADFAGRPMVCCALEALKQFGAEKTVVVASCTEVANLARTYGFDVAENNAPQLGQAYSVRLGIEKMMDMDAVLLMVADQPLLSAGSLAALLAAYKEDDRGLACLRDSSHKGNPAIFDRTYYGQLMCLEGDRGAKGILRENEEDLMVVNCLYPMELADADDASALNALKAWYMKMKCSDGME